MPSGLCIATCNHFEPELRRALADEGLAEVQVAIFPAMCGRPRMAWSELCGLLLKGGKRGWEHLELICGACCLQSGEAPPSLGSCRTHLFDNCQEFVVNGAFAGSLVGSGAYLATPGWLSCWRETLRDWGFDQATALTMFRESAQCVTLLDTGIREGVAEELAEFSDYVGLPHKSYAVGMDGVRAQVARLALEWRVEKAGKDSRENSRLLSEQAMAMDVVGQLARLNVKTGAAEKALALFSQLFAPSRTSLVTINDDGTPEVIVSGEGQADAGELLSRADKAGTEYSVSPTGAGFLLRLAEGDRVTGVIEVEGVAFPQYLQRYLAEGINIARIVNLALANERAYSHLQTNIAKLEAAEGRLHEALDELRRSNADLEQFAVAASHDLQSPLAQVQTFLKLLKVSCEEQLDDSAMELLNGAVGGAEEMLGLIRDLLAYARLGRQGEKVAEVDCDKVIERACDLLRSQIADADANIHCDSLPIVYGNRTQLVQLFMNLLSNAIKYRRDGPPIIRIGARGEGEFYEFSVSDDGMGIPVEYRDAIFQVFTRVAGRKPHQGTGIGLALCKRIVEFHGGTIRVESKPGEGSNFLFTLPAEGPAAK